ncbi:hypothetical protein [Frigoribacterium sp. CG_9.8]|uniref:hypothetical protein n=1 Tax=Frigoribacterium sp. CG_9.8 TaxID=2787733 RepID=UPI0018C9A2D7|nr:hypothetical protein [Frigoribacterium sp. CG_9.8]MBG6108783.1 hypothetical protein [Frigoribacterium sp. CG_9.8]
MRTSERVLGFATVILIATVIVLCWGISSTQQSYDTSGSGAGMPWPIIWVRIGTSVAPIFALVGLASAAGLLFLRAVRWTDTPAEYEEPTPEPSP